MSATDLKWSQELRAAGKELGRAGMSQRAIAAIESFDGTYKGAMKVVGRMKAIAEMAKSDEYWSEKVSDGYQLERNLPVRGESQ